MSFTGSIVVMKESDNMTNLPGKPVSVPRKRWADQRARPDVHTRPFPDTAQAASTLAAWRLQAPLGDAHHHHLRELPRRRPRVGARHARALGARGGRAALRGSRNL